MKILRVRLNHLDILTFMTRQWFITAVVGSMWFRHRRFSTVKLSCNGLQSYKGPTDSYSEAKCSNITCS